MLILHVGAALWAAALAARTRDWRLGIVTAGLALLALACCGEFRQWPSAALIVLEAALGVLALIGLAAVEVSLTPARAQGRLINELARTLATTDSAVVITDSQLDAPGPRIVAVNDAMCRMTGYTPNELLGVTPRILQGPGTDRAVMNDLRRALARGTSFCAEALNYRKDGSTYWVSWSICPIIDRKGRVTHFLSIQQDVTQRLEVEQRLEMEARRYQIIVETALEGIWLVNREWKTVYANRQMAEMLGTTPEVMLGKRITEFMSPSELGAAARHMSERERGVPARHEFRFTRADGAPLLALVSTNSFVDDQGGFTGALAMVTDIGHQLRAQKELREALDRLNSHVNTSPLAVIEWGQNFATKMWSAGAERIFGWTADDVLGLHPAEWNFVYAEDLDRVRAAMDELSDGTTDRNICLNRNNRKDGSVGWTEWYNSVLRDPSGNIVSILSLAQDVTERHLAEERQRLLMLELDHRVKNNLATVLGITEQSLDTATDIHQFASSFRGRIGALARAHGVLSRARWENVDLAELCARVLEPFNNIRIDTTPVKLTAREGELLALTLYELATNASKHGSLRVPGGSVDVRWRVEPARAAAAGSSSGVLLMLQWQERGGPSIEPPTRSGFGSQFISQGVPYQLGASVDLIYDPDGFRCEIRAPLGAPPDARRPPAANTSA
ncbi:MAG: PAS domain S-box protein [Planctomycetota bacterium]|nr:PAS domain S-box protein [Planctomycetota bacterium]